MIRHGTARHGHNASVRDADSNQDGAEQHRQADVPLGGDTVHIGPCNRFRLESCQWKYRREYQPCHCGKLTARDWRRVDRCGRRRSLNGLRTAAGCRAWSTAFHLANRLRISPNRNCSRHHLRHQKEGGKSESDPGTVHADVDYDGFYVRCNGLWRAEAPEMAVGETITFSPPFLPGQQTWQGLC